MFVDVKVLDLLYRQTAPETILQALKQSLHGSSGQTTEYMSHPVLDKKHFWINAEATLHGYSEDEHMLLFERLNQRRLTWEDQGISTDNAFLVPLLDAANEYLTIDSGEPMCREDKVLEWRDAYLKLGQDIFVCAFLAAKDWKEEKQREEFTWPVILRMDNEKLYSMLSYGIAENHNHLAGGTQSFQITWCRLMNYPEVLRNENELKNFKSYNLFAKMNRADMINDDNSHLLNMFKKVELAALIRIILFKALHRDDFSESSPSGEEIPFEGRVVFDKEYFLSTDYFNTLVDTASVLRTDHGMKLPVLGEPKFCLDYAYEEKYAKKSIDSNIRIVVGERAFIYQCIRACLEKAALSESGYSVFSPFERELFYLYLVLQCNFRSEMIQNNGQVGFMNFKNYQDRKDDSWDKSLYLSDAVRMAINNRMHQEQIVSLEGRVVPKAILQKNIDKAIRYDTCQRFSDLDSEKAINPKNYEFDPDLSDNLFSNSNWFYVFHFIKVQDNRKLKPDSSFSFPCRHEDHREFTKKQAIGLADALRNSRYLRSRVRGIDSASDEVVCRPEIFACSFRYMEGIQNKWNADKKGGFLFTPMQISKAYHAGEDFMDIAGGLRAMDEAIRFLHLGKHSRIGHGLALGVDPEVHYHTKHFETVMTRQERLDDLIWILFRGKDLGITATNEQEEALMDRLTAEANDLLQYIYGDAIKEENWSINLQYYWFSMLLRGDEPSLYRTKTYKHPGMSGDEFSMYLVDDTVPNLDTYRKDKQIAGLYYYYHYGTCEWRKSQETYTFRVDADYIRLMRRLQDAMISFIQEKKIIIETNPSSNVLIGTFKDYQHHPIFRFNNHRLHSVVEETSPQLNVCVNTDDLGVFDTALDFEYALLYAALKERRNEDSSTYTYSDDDIIEYLNNLREQGIQAVFPPNLTIGDDI